MKNEFLDIVASPLMNLDHTFRYSGTKLVESESLSQHITDTIMMGLKIIDEINTRYGEIKLSPEEYVMKAVYHDLEEVITGDIPRPLKYYNEATLESMRDVADSVAESLFDKEFHSDYPHYDVWSNAKDHAEGLILKIVDNLVVVNKVIKEVSLLQNHYMLRVAHEVIQYTSEIREMILRMDFKTMNLDKRIKDYLVDLLDGAIKSVGDILEENDKVMHDLKIYAQSMI